MQGSEALPILAPKLVVSYIFIPLNKKEQPQYNRGFSYARIYLWEKESLEAYL